MNPHFLRPGIKILWSGNIAVSYFDDSIFHMIRNKIITTTMVMKIVILKNLFGRLFCLNLYRSDPRCLYLAQSLFSAVLK